MIEVSKYSPAKVPAAPPLVQKESSDQETFVPPVFEEAFVQNLEPLSLPIIQTDYPRRTAVVGNLYGHDVRGEIVGRVGRLEADIGGVQLLCETVYVHATPGNFALEDLKKKKGGEKIDGWSGREYAFSRLIQLKKNTDPVFSHFQVGDFMLGLDERPMSASEEVVLYEKDKAA